MSLAELLENSRNDLGAAKQALAVQYVALASHGAEVSSLDLSALFKGT